MWLTPEWVLAICAGVTLLILWTATIIGAVLWLTARLEKLKKEILRDLDEKHQANETRVEALHTLVMRHDIILDPEFNNGSGRRRSS